MKKNIFNEEVKTEIIERSRKLSSESQPMWGSLNAPEMLRHCTEALKITLSQTRAKRPSTLKQKLTRMAMLYVIPHFPKGAKTPLVLDIKQKNLNGLSLHTEQAAFEDQLNAFQKFDGELTTRHPYFGNLNRRQWGIATWMHLDHHLRQFGV